MNISAVAVIDDDERQAETVAELLVDAGYSPFVIPHPKETLSSVDELVCDVRGRADAAVCDHRLSPMKFASFAGSDAVAALYDARIPAVLITQYAQMDSDVSIRRWRHKIPIVLARDDAQPNLIRESLDLCGHELEGDIAPFRRPHRSLLRVAARRNEDGEDVLDIFVIQWRPHTAVRLPVTCVPPAILEDVDASHPFLIAQVNIEARDAAELYFRDFEIAPRIDRGK